MTNFNNQEAACSGVFEFLRPLWHLWTSEGLDIILPDKAAFEAAMTILAICANLSPGITVITYELMSNHLHMVISGPKDIILKFFTLFRRHLRRYLKGRGLSVPDSFECSLREITTLDEARNVITYNNRNGYVVSPDSSPFSYRWGANQYFFNPEAKQRFYDASAKKVSQRERRKLMHSHISDGMNNPPVALDGCACPMGFCNIDAGEKVFRNATHYFRDVSRNVEAARQIATQIGERVYYNDDDLFAVVQRICKDRYSIPRPSMLPGQAKVEVAKQLHFDYNAGNKQISRMLKMDQVLVDSLFPSASPSRDQESRK